MSTLTEFDKYIAQIGRARLILPVNDNIFEQLKHPAHLVEVSIPVRMDDGTMKIFTGWRSLFNGALGPGKGGLRFHPLAHKEEVVALSAWMALKCAMMNIHLGGGKGAVKVDYKTLHSSGELERIARGYIRKVAYDIGDTIDIPAPDVNTSGRLVNDQGVVLCEAGQIMAWMLDEYEIIKGHHEGGVITGKPLCMGGSEGREKATATGAFMCTDEAAKKLNLPKISTFAVTGFGNAGHWYAMIMRDHGYLPISVSDTGGIIADRGGLNLEAVYEAKQKFGSVTAYKGKGVVTGELAQEIANSAVIYAPAAFENTLTAEIAENTQAKLVVELANGPTTSEAALILARRKIIVLPDIMASGGGVTVSYFEQVQNRSYDVWSAEVVHAKLDQHMRQAFRDAWEISENCTMRDAAVAIGMQRIAIAMTARGYG